MNNLIFKNSFTTEEPSFLTQVCEEINHCGVNTTGMIGV